MDKGTMTRNSTITYILIWLMSIMYYNVNECIIYLDYYQHIGIYHYHSLDMKVPFMIYPVLLYLVCYTRKIDVKIVYFGVLLALCLLYSYIVIFFNLQYFPIKTWGILCVFFSSVLAYVWIDNKIKQFVSLGQEGMGNCKFSGLFSLVIIIAIVCTAVCHSLIVI